MSLRTRWMALRLAVFATAAMVLTLAAMPPVALASDIAGKDVAGPTVGEAAAPDALPPGDTTAPQMMNDDGDFWNGWWIIMPIMMVIFWGGVIALVVWGIRQFTGDREGGRSPLDIAKERLARGEITKEEFDRIRGDLA